MKKTLFFLFTILILTQTIQSQDSFLENITLPADNLGGIVPEEVIYADDKLFVYSTKSILVLDPANYTILKSIEISSRGSAVFDSKSTIEYSGQKSKMAYDNNGTLYAINGDQNVVSINTSDIGSPIPIVIERPTDVPIDRMLNPIIKFNLSNNRIFISYLYKAENINHSYFAVYDAANYGKIYHETDDFVGDGIQDIEVNEAHNIIYLCCDNNIKSANALSNSYFPNNLIEDNPGNYKLLFIENALESKLFAINKYNSVVNWVDGSTNITDSFSAPTNVLTSLSYNQDDNELLIGSHEYLYIFDASPPYTYNLLDYISIGTGGEDDQIFSVSYHNNNIYLCTKDEILRVDNNNALIAPPPVERLNNYFLQGCINETSQEIIFINMQGHAIEVLNSSGTFNSKLNTGASVFKSCLNPINDEAYFYTDQLLEDGSISIVDFSDHSVSQIPFEHPIGQIIHNATGNNNHILVSKYANQNTISRFDGETHAVLDITISNPFCNAMYIPENGSGKLYCATGTNVFENSCIEILDAETYSLITKLEDWNPGHDNEEMKFSFCHNSTDNETVYFIASPANSGSSWGHLGVIDGNNDLTLIDIAQHNPKKILYYKEGNRLILQYHHSSQIEIFHCNNLNDRILIDYGQGTTVNDIETHDSHQYLYVACGTAVYAEKVGYQQVISVGLYQLESFISSLIFNPKNERLYAYSPITYSDHTVNVWALENFDFQQKIYLENNHTHRGSTNLFYNSLVLSEERNFLYIPNGAHSNISAVKHGEKLPLTLNNDGEVWISLPRLQSEYTLANTALNNRIQPGLEEGDEGKMTGNDNQTMEKSYVEWVWNQQNLVGEWLPMAGNELDYVNSKAGYILDLDYVNGTSEITLDLFGDLLAPDASIQILYALAEEEVYGNWIGYWLTESQHPLDAFADVLDELMYIKGQDWFCANSPNLNKAGTSNPGGPGPASQWHCIEPARLDYGDMVDVRPYEDLLGFQYNSSLNQASGGEPPTSQNFSYTEQGMYSGLVIELDTTDNPLEIGAFVGDTCIGAAVVQPDDSLCLLQAYTETVNGQITFQEFYGSNKTQTERIREYYVSDHFFTEREYRSIDTRERKPMYYISLKNSETPSQVVPATAVLECYPNPFSQHCNINLIVLKQDQMALEVLDEYGRVVQQLENGNKSPGSYSIQWNPATAKLPRGVYVLRLTTSTNVLTKKVMYVF